MAIGPCLQRSYGVPTQHAIAQLHSLRIVYYYGYYYANMYICDDFTETSTPHIIIPSIHTYNSIAACSHYVTQVAVKFYQVNQNQNKGERQYEGQQNKK